MSNHFVSSHVIHIEIRIVLCHSSTIAPVHHSLSLSFSSSTFLSLSLLPKYVIRVVSVWNNNVLKTRPVSLVVQIVVDDNADDSSAAHGHGARSRICLWFRFTGRPGCRTLSTYAVAGPTITATKGPHRGDLRDRQLRQDGGHDTSDYAVMPDVS